MYRSIGRSTGKEKRKKKKFKNSKALYLLPYHGKMNKRNLLQAMRELSPANTLLLLLLLLILPLPSGVLSATTSIPCLQSRAAKCGPLRDFTWC